MQPLSDDVVEFISNHFDASDIPRVLQALQSGGDVLSAPRVQRAVLFLSGGSVAMLRHYVATATLDVREILLRAKYVLGATAAPMPVRTTERAVEVQRGSAGPMNRASGPPGPPARPPGRAERRKAVGGADRHRHLVGRRFTLGDVDYVVSRDQPQDACVRCLRNHGNVVSIVHLPLIFVLEQLSEENIELQEE